MSNRIKIAFFHDSEPWGSKMGGIATYILHRASILSKNNFNVYWSDGLKVAFFNNSINDWEIIKEFNAGKFFRVKKRLPDLLPGIKYLIDEIKIDIIEFPDSYSYKIKPLKKKCKVVIQCHTSSPVREFLNDLRPGIRSKLNAKRIKKNLLNADKILACSYEIALLTSGFYKIHTDYFNVIPHAFAKELFNDKKAEQRERENYFIAVANVEYLKGIDLLLKAFLQYKKNGGKNKLYYVGPKHLFDVPPPMDKKWIQLGTDKLLSELKAEDFEFIAYLTKEKVYDLMRKASATIVLSRFEAFTMVIGEASLVECPLIVSNRLGWNNLVNKFDAGILVNPYNKEEVANAMIMVENKNTVNEYSENIKNLYGYLISDELYSKTVNFYKSAVNEK